MPDEHMQVAANIVLLKVFNQLFDACQGLSLLNGVIADGNDIDLDSKELFRAQIRILDGIEAVCEAQGFNHDNDPHSFFKTSSELKADLVKGMTDG